MTEAGEEWIEKVNKSRAPGGEVGIVHPIDGLNLLRAFCDEVEKRAQGRCSHVPNKIFSTCVGDAYANLKRELLG